LPAEEKIIRALDLALKKFLHWLGEFKVSSKWLEKRAQKIIEENKISDYLKDSGIYLDVGCGTGHIMYKLEEINCRKAVQFVGIDAFNYPPRKVRRKIARIRKRMEFYLLQMEEKRGIKIPRMDFGKIGKREREAQIFAFALAEKLFFKDESFDGVTMFYLLHHLDLSSQKKALEEAKRVIGSNPDQYLFVLEEIIDSDSEVQKRISKRNDMLLNPEIKRSPHNYRSNEGLTNLFREVGLEIVKAHYYVRYCLVGLENRPLRNAFFVLRKANKD